jgi:hypothetical protein
MDRKSPAELEQESAEMANRLEVRAALTPAYATVCAQTTQKHMRNIENARRYMEPGLALVSVDQATMSIIGEINEMKKVEDQIQLELGLAPVLTTPGVNEGFRAQLKRDLVLVRSAQGYRYERADAIWRHSPGGGPARDIAELEAREVGAHTVAAQQHNRLTVPARRRVPSGNPNGGDWPPPAGLTGFVWSRIVDGPVERKAHDPVMVPTVVAPVQTELVDLQELYH